MEELRWLPFPSEDKQLEAEIKSMYNDFTETRTGKKVIEIGYYGTVAIMFASYYINRKKENDKNTRTSIPRVSTETIHRQTRKRENSV